MAVLILICKGAGTCSIRWIPQALCWRLGVQVGEVGCSGLWSETAWVQAPAPPLSSCVTLEMFLNLSVPQSLPLSTVKGG